MCKNKVQFQKGLSLTKFMDNFGTEAQCEVALEAANWFVFMRQLSPATWPETNDKQLVRPMLEA